jgi:hypothetical protein
MNSPPPRTLAFFTLKSNNIFHFHFVVQIAKNSVMQAIYATGNPHAPAVQAHIHLKIAPIKKQQNAPTVMVHTAQPGLAVPSIKKLKNRSKSAKQATSVSETR